MDTSQSPPILSIFDALQIFKDHNNIKDQAIKNIMKNCNIPVNKTTLGRLQRKLNTAINDRLHARKSGKLDTWLSDAKCKEFCKFLPPPISHSDTDNDSDTDYVISPKRQKCTKSPITSNLNRSTIQKRVKDILPSLESIAEAENTDLVQLLLIVLSRQCKGLGWVNLAELLYSAFSSMKDIDSKDIPLEKCSYLMVSQELGRERYMDLRNSLQSEGNTVHPWHTVNAHCHEITPEHIPVTLDISEEVIGYRFKFTDVCKYFIHRALQAAQVTVDNVPDKLYIGGKDGTDGSGQHYRRAQVHVAVKGNIILYSFTPLIICSGDNANGKVLWRNPAPNSALTQRPLAVIAAKEDRDEVLRPLIPQIEEDITNVSTNGFAMQYIKKDVTVTVRSSFTMFDDKMRAALQGTGGAYCQMCKFSKINCHCTEYVINGFPIDHKIEDMHSIFNFLTESGEMPVPKKQGDYDTRLGLTAEPITHRDLNESIPVTHAWMRCAQWFLHIIYHVIGNHKTWGFGNKIDKKK